MTRWLQLLVLPALGAALVFAGYAWSRPDLAIVRHGIVVPGRIAGHIIVRNQEHLLLHTVTRKVVLTRSDGATLAGTFSNLTLAATGDTDWPEGSAVLPALGFADAEILRRVAQRESSTTSAARLVSLEVTETVQGIQSRDFPKSVTVAQGRPHMDGEPIVVETHALFRRPDTSTPGVPVDWMTGYTRTVDGQPVAPPARKDFAWSAEAYATEFRPVFTYTLPGGEAAALSDLGRRGGPSPIYPLFSVCRVAVHEDDVRLLPDYAAKDVKKAPLVWFSFVSEAFFSRWSVLCLLATAGGLVLFAGLTIISLALHPSVRLLREGEADTTRPSTPVS